MENTASINRLLIVDDDALVCELLNHLLQKDGIEVTVANSVSAAMRLLESATAGYDAILSDLQMPGTGGLELSRDLRRTNQTALLLGMSARAPQSHEQQAFDAFLQKPFTVPELHEALWHAASKRRRSQHLSQQENISPRNDSLGPLPETGASPANGRMDPLGSLAQTQVSLPEAVLDRRIFEQLRAAIGAAPLRQLLEMTATDAELRLARMRESLAVGDLETVRQEAHAIKGGCAMVGAVELSQLAAAAEVSSETDSFHIIEMFEACVRLRRMVTIVSP